MLHNPRLERLASGKHSNLLGPFVSCKENGVLQVQCQNIELLTFQNRKDQIKNVDWSLKSLKEMKLNSGRLQSYQQKIILLYKRIKHSCFYDKAAITTVKSFVVVARDISLK